MGLKTTEEHFITEYQRGITNKHLTDLFMDSFFAAWFRERVDEPLDYKKTAIYSSLIHGLGSGLIYPGVMSAGAVNIAIPATDFDKYFEGVFHHPLPRHERPTIAHQSLEIKAGRA